MKHLAKTSLVAIALAFVAAASVQADDTLAFHNRVLAQASVQSPAAERTTTVAVYSGNGRAVGNQVAPEQQSTLNLRSNNHGQITGEFRGVQ